jgi:DNA-binding transcriptional regulator YdaS (Cro superfamily)
MQRKAIKTLVRHLGGATVVANNLGVTVAAVSKWKRIPAVRVHDLVRLSRGRYTPEQLRPDVFRAA